MEARKRRNNIPACRILPVARILKSGIGSGGETGKNQNSAKAAIPLLSKVEAGKLAVFLPYSRVTLFCLFTLLTCSLVTLSGCGKKGSPEQHTVYYGDSISSGDTLVGVFMKYDISAANYYEVISKLSTVFRVQEIQVGDYYEIVLSTSNRIMEFSYSQSPEIKYSVRHTTGGYMAAKIKLKLVRKIMGYRGTVKNNLWSAMVSAGVNPAVIYNFTEIFESKIDFLTDQRPGDKFSIVVEQYFTEEGHEVDKGTILVGKYTRKKKNREYIAFEYPFNAGLDYYDSRGNSLATQFMKSPLRYRRISSVFSNRRFHPILKYYRAHHGIDYAAPRGTPVSTIGDGKVLFVGRNGGYGKMIKIKHNSVYESWYGHLSKYRSGLRSGQYVKKGQTIGYVGSTGLSTGPHLDFRIKKKGRFINFLRLKLPPAKRLSKKQMKKFSAVKKNYYTYLAKIQMEGRFEQNDPSD